jgi:hypothetical protein
LAKIAMDVVDAVLARDGDNYVEVLSRGEPAAALQRNG